MLALRNRTLIKAVCDIPIRFNTTTKHPTIPMVHELHDIVKWRKPDKLAAWDPRKTGDLQELPKIDPKTIKVEFRALEDKINALPEEYRKLFSVGFGRRKDTTKFIKYQMCEAVQRHKYDCRYEHSIETKIAWMTFKIRSFRDLAETKEKGEIRIYTSKGIIRKAVKELTEKRRKYLNKLRHLDYKRFEWLLESLGVLFKPLPEDKQIRRRPCVDRLTGIICDEIIASKMAAYKEELEGQKIPFLEEKLAILLEIKADEEEMNLASSVDEDIMKTKKALDQLRGPQIEIRPLGETLLSQ